MTFVATLRSYGIASRNFINTFMISLLHQGWPSCVIVRSVCQRDMLTDVDQTW